MSEGPLAVFIKRHLFCILAFEEYKGFQIFYDEEFVDSLYVSSVHSLQFDLSAATTKFT